MTTRTSFEPALSFAQMEAFGPVGADVTPAALVAIWARYASSRFRNSHVSCPEELTVFEPVAWRLLGIVRKGC